MRRPNELEREEQAMATLVELTSVFEGIASMRIAQIRNQVLQSTQFFHELWHIYSQIRVDSSFRFGRGASKIEVSDRELFLIITSEGGFSGDIDQRLVEAMMKVYDRSKHDVVVVGNHGALQLAQRGVPFKKYYKLPVKDQNINVTPITDAVRQYASTQVFYQEYVSLMVQEVRHIALSAAVQERGEKATATDEVITESNYIFEPSTRAVVDHLENSMMQIAISQVILESKLAQYASRFKAMSAAKDKSEEGRDELHLAFNRAKRAVKDERLKEIINGLRKAGSPA
jgi:F-type H+-transporting ATPase subunit gamma